MADPAYLLFMLKVAEQKLKDDIQKQQKIDDEAQKYCVDAINQVESHIARKSDNYVEYIKSNSELENDEQTRRFFDFIQLASNFSSMKFVERLQKVPELIASIKKLFIDMIEQIKELADMACEFQKLIHCFIQLVVNTKRNMELVISPLKQSITHMEVIADALSPDSTKPLDIRNKEDIEIALKGMSSGIVKLLDLARRSKQESIDLDNKIAIMQGKVLQKRIVVEGRLKLSECAPWLEGVGSTLGVAAGGVGATAAIDANILGGVGVLEIGGMTFSPVYAIIAAAVMGGAFLGTIVYLVRNFWKKQNEKALKYLNEILELLVQLSDANLSFSTYMNKAEVRASKILSETDEIQRTITSGSQRYRKINVHLCNEAIKSTKAVIACIDEIVLIDMSEWTNSSSVLKYPPTREAIKN